MASINTKATEEDMYSLKKVVYEYLKKYGSEDCKYLQEVDYDAIMSIDTRVGDIDSKMQEKLFDAYEKIDSEYKNISKDFADIQRIFRASVFKEVWENKKYEFYESEVEFICNLLYKYKHENLWKKIKKVDNSHLDGFVKIYKQDDSAGILKDLEFVVEGFVKMYERRNRGEFEKIKDFKDELMISTQIEQIKCMEGMKEVLFSLPTLTFDDAVASPRGILLNDYQKFLCLLQKKIEEVMNAAKKIWDQDVAERHKELEDYILLPPIRIGDMDFSDDSKQEIFNRATDQFFRILEETDKGIYEYVKSGFDGKDIVIPFKSGSLKDRHFRDRAKKEVQKSFDLLPKDEQNALSEIIDKLLNWE